MTTWSKDCCFHPTATFKPCLLIELLTASPANSTTTTKPLLSNSFWHSFTHRSFSVSYLASCSSTLPKISSCSLATSYFTLPSPSISIKSTYILTSFPTNSNNLSSFPSKASTQKYSTVSLQSELTKKYNSYCKIVSENWIFLERHQPWGLKLASK